jgi:hypothetical protein
MLCADSHLVQQRHSGRSLVASGERDNLGPPTPQLTLLLRLFAEGRLELFQLRLVVASLQQIANSGLRRP